jgi:hypothetical protein
MSAYFPLGLTSCSTRDVLDKKNRTFSKISVSSCFSSVCSNGVALYADLDNILISAGAAVFPLGEIMPDLDGVLISAGAAVFPLGENVIGVRVLMSGREAGNFSVPIFGRRYDVAERGGCCIFPGALPLVVYSACGSATPLPAARCGLSGTT